MIIYVCFASAHTSSYYFTCSSGEVYLTEVKCMSDATHSIRRLESAPPLEGASRAFIQNGAVASYKFYVTNTILSFRRECLCFHKRHVRISFANSNRRSSLYLSNNLLYVYRFDARIWPTICTNIDISENSLW